MDFRKFIMEVSLSGDVPTVNDTYQTPPAVLVRVANFYIPVKSVWTRGDNTLIIDTVQESLEYDPIDDEVDYLPDSRLVE